jgi:hypothetical protein
MAEDYDVDASMRLLQTDVTKLRAEIKSVHAHLAHYRKLVDELRERLRARITWQKICQAVRRGDARHCSEPCQLCERVVVALAGKKEDRSC